MPNLLNEVVLWETADGMRCLSARREHGPPFEITIAHRNKVLTRMAFEHDEDAADFAIAVMQEPDGFLRRMT
jgi:hypothetical protein